MGQHCDEALANLYMFLDHEIGEEAARRISEHIGDCEPCGDVYEFEERLRTVVRERLSEEVPEEVLNRIRQALQAD